MLKYLKNHNRDKKELERITPIIYSEVEQRIDFQTIKQKYSLSDSEWYRISSKIYKEYRRRNPSTNWNQEIRKNVDVNKKLKPIALGFPRYGTTAELEHVSKKLSSFCVDYSSVKKYMIGVIMSPNLRAMQLESCFIEERISTRENIFYPFAYIIDSATLAYYRGNYTAALMTIIPVIEGILLRWQGYPQKIKTKPTFEESIKFVRNFHIRQPMPNLRPFVDSWQENTIHILEHALYKHSNKGPAIDNYNRHLALHLLDDINFCSELNVVRSFLILEYLFELFVAEIGIPYYQFNMKYGTIEIQGTRTYNGYMTAFSEGLKQNNPENNLMRYGKIEKLS